MVKGVPEPCESVRCIVYYITHKVYLLFYKNIDFLLTVIWGKNGPAYLVKVDGNTIRCTIKCYLFYDEEQLTTCTRKQAPKNTMKDTR